MQEDALDDTCFLCLACHVDEALVGIAAIVVFGDGRPPLIGVVGQFLLALVLVEHLNGRATHGHSHDTHLHILG